MGKGTGMLQNWNVFNVPWTVFERLFQNLDIFVILACQSVPAKGDCAKEFFNRCKSISKQGWVCLDKYIVPNQTGWIGTVEVNLDDGLDPGETFCLCFSPSSSPMPWFASTAPIQPVWLGTIYLSRHTQPCLNILLHPLKNFWRNHLLQEHFGMLKWQKMSKFWNNHSKTV